MGLFSRKLSPEQERIIQKYSDKLGSICTSCVQIYAEAMVAVQELMLICFPARMSESDPTGVDNLIKPAFESITKYSDLLGDAKERYASLTIEDWFPKSYKKERESWDLFFNLQIKCIPMVIEALSPPDPLKMRSSDGKTKLNMFISGMNMLATSTKLDVISALISKIQPNK